MGILYLMDGSPGSTKLSRGISSRFDHLHGLNASAVHTRTTISGREVYWRIWGTGPPVVLLHGGYGSWTHWIRTIGELSRNYTILAPDLPGFGDSHAPRGRATLSGLARPIALGIRQILPTARQSYDLVGFSFGGRVGAALALHDSGRVRSLVLVAPGGMPLVVKPVRLRNWRHLKTPSARAAVHRMNLKALMFADEAAIDDVAIGLQAENVRRGRVKVRNMRGALLLSEYLPAIRVPVGAIYGTLDATVYPHLRLREQHLRELVPTIDFRTKPGAGHWVQYERPHAFTRTLIRMLHRFDKGIPAHLIGGVAVPSP